MEKLLKKLKSLLREPLLNNWTTRKIFVQKLVANSRKLKNEYIRWVYNNYPTNAQLEVMRQNSAQMSYQPLISVIMPTYNPKIVYLHEVIESVLNNAYQNWELVIVDDASPNQKVRDVIKQYAAKDSRIKYHFSTTNNHIAASTNIGISMSQGEYVAFLDHDDFLYPNALYEVAKAIDANREVEIFYSDEDMLSEDSVWHFGELLKPDWNYELMRSCNIFTHLTVVSRRILEATKLADGVYEDGEYNGCQDWELCLRITRAIDDSKIYHIPKLLYSWRVHDMSTAMNTAVKPYVTGNQHKMLIDDAKKRGAPDANIRVTESMAYVQYPLKNTPLVSIVIPSKNQYPIVKQCIDSICQKSTYPNFEIVLVDTGSTDQRVLNWYKSAVEQYGVLRVESFVKDKFSYVDACNYGASLANGEILIMLNNDTEVLTANWIENLAGEAARSEIGAVGCKLYFPKDYNIEHKMTKSRVIQHAGVSLRILPDKVDAVNVFAGISVDDIDTRTKSIMYYYKRSSLAVTAACLAIRKSVFDEIGGFDKAFDVTYNDVDLCLRLVKAGYRNIYDPQTELIHHESISLGRPGDSGRDDSEYQQSVALLEQRWGKFIGHDPCFNTNLPRETHNFSIDFNAVTMVDV